MATGTLDLEFVGNASGLQDAVAASQRALLSLERQTRSVSSSLGRILRTIVAPIAGVILSAFAAKKALADFANSSLPGAAQFQGAMARMRGSMRRLSESVGELLAPVAQRTALLISNIADRLAPLVRIVTAFIASSGPFLRQLGQNFLTALRPLLPTVFAFFDRIIAFWQGINWGSTMNSLRAAWNRAWAAILEFVAPIIIRLASLIETFIAVAVDLLGKLATWFQGIIQMMAEWLGIDLADAAKNGINGIVAAIQTGLIVAIAVVEIALKNLATLWDFIKTAGLLAFQIIKDNWKGVGEYILDVLKVLGTNLLTIFSNIGTMLLPIFSVMGRNIGAIFLAVWDYIAANLVIKLGRAAMEATLAILKPIRDNPILATLLLGPGAALTIADSYARIQAALNKMPLGADLVVPRPEGLPPINPADVGRGTRRPPGYVPKGSQEAGDLQERLEILLASLKGTFGAGIADAIADAIKRSPDLLAKIGAGLPGVNGIPVPAGLAPQTAGAALQFGTAAAFSAENATKNPLEEKADVQIALTREQLVHQRAAARAAQRRFRLASI